RSKRGRRIFARWSAPCMLTRSTLDFLFTNKESNVHPLPMSARYFVMPTSLGGSKSSADHSGRKGSDPMASRSWVISMAGSLGRGAVVRCGRDGSLSAVDSLRAVDPLGGPEERLEQLRGFGGPASLMHEAECLPQ